MPQQSCEHGTAELFIQETPTICRSCISWAKLVFSECPPLGYLFIHIYHLFTHDEMPQCLPCSRLSCSSSLSLSS